MRPIQLTVRWRDVVSAYGFSWRKRSLVREFTGLADVRFVARGTDVPANSDLLLWGSAGIPSGLPERVRLVRLEDGFLRSVGLGADLYRPLSWVIDTHGIYYDARTPSRLELLLQTTAFSQLLIERAAALRLHIVQHGLSKYNLGGAAWKRPEGARQVVLVIGQVETDASIATGTIDIRTNMALLQAVRQARPLAWVIYKPHPDVVAGLRRSGSHEHQASQWCDEVLEHGSPAQILDQVDEVHVMTSLTGFEALLRHKPVFCYGQPFYSGWGLTQDRHPHPRRACRLSLDELVAGALLLYPTYVSQRDRKPCTPEQALRELQEMRSRRPGDHLPWWRRALRPLLARP